MEVTTLIGIFEFFKNTILQIFRWNKMSAYLIKTSFGENIRLQYLVSNSGTHELLISDLEVEIGGEHPCGGGVSINNLMLPIKINPKGMEVVSIELPKSIFDDKYDDAFFVVVMTVYTLKGQQYYMYKRNSFDLFNCNSEPFHLDKKGAWLKERWGIEPSKKI